MINAHRDDVTEPVCRVTEPGLLCCELALAEVPSVWRSLVRLDTPEVVDGASLRTFLETYRLHVMTPIELPAVRDAYLHTGRYEVRELIALDAALGQAAPLARFAEASRAAGRSQLRRFLPMRDQRLVRRYWHAIELGEAYGCHAVVFGVAMSLFSLPLRQGLLHYAHQTLRGFLLTGARRLALAEVDITRLLVEVAASLPADVNRTLALGEPQIRVAR